MLDAILLLLAQAVPAPAPEAPAKPPVTAETANDESCEDAKQPDADTRTIVVCAQRPQGYQRREGQGTVPEVCRKRRP